MSINKFSSTMQSYNQSRSHLVQTYNKARTILHNQIKDEHLLGTVARLDREQVTLTKDVNSGELTFKAGSSYNLKPYSGRHHSEETICFEKDNATTVVRHQCDPGWIKTEETLEMTSQGLKGQLFELPAGIELLWGGIPLDCPNKITTRIRDNTSGIKPEGWVKGQLTLEQAEGYNLAF